MNIRIFVNSEKQYLLYGALEFALENPKQALWLAYSTGYNHIPVKFFNHSKVLNLDVEYVGNVNISPELSGTDIFTLIKAKIDASKFRI